MTPETNIISYLITVAPVVGALILWIIHLKNENKHLQVENKSLQTELRTSEKEAISVTKDLNTTLEKLIASINK